MRNAGSISALITAVLLICGCGSPSYQGQHPSTRYRDRASDIPENIASLNRIAVKASDDRPGLIVERDHEGRTGDEVARGTLKGVDVAGEMVSEDASGVLLLPIVLPVAMIAGAIGGSMRAEVMAAQKEEADKLLEIERQPLPSQVLADHVQT